MKKNYLRTTLTAMTLFFAITAFAQQSNQTVQIGATQRSYIRYLPSGLNASEEPSLIFILHGLWDPLESTCRHASLSIL